MLNRMTTLCTFYVAALVISELMATKLVHIGWYVGPAAVIIYPFSFMLADVFTELYGGETARRAVWLGFIVLLIFVAWTSIGTLLPALSGTTATANAYNTVFGFVPRVVGASLVAYVVGETLNVSIMAWMRKKKWFGARTILSTAVGQLFDSSIFITVAFMGAVPGAVLGHMVFTQYLAKVLIEALLGTPMAYAFLRWARRRGGQDANRLAS